MTAVARAEMSVERLTETDELPWQRRPQMGRTDGGWWVMPASEPRFPIIYALKATKRS
ncbi:hypothetical protein [Mycobacterium sp. 050134]|uniref:hypothetical protein n=1 Tax=Mycobacterium sp. 050134 TaxID=3096111 RepID=UPI002EDB52F0